MNNYLKGKLLFKLNKNYLFKIKIKEVELNFGKVSFFSYDFNKFLILLFINFKIISLIKIFIAKILNYYDHFVFIESNLKLVGHAFIQRRKKKYYFMNKKDSMLGEIYVSKSFRNNNFATTMSIFLLKKTFKNYQNVFYVCDKVNKPSVKLASKCGFDLIKF